MKKLVLHIIGFLLGALLILIGLSVRNHFLYHLEIGPEGKHFYIQDTLSRNGQSLLIVKYYPKEKRFIYIRAWESPKWEYEPGGYPLGYHQFVSLTPGNVRGPGLVNGTTISTEGDIEITHTEDGVFTIVELEDTTVVLPGRVMIGHDYRPVTTGDHYTFIGKAPKLGYEPGDTSVKNIAFGYHHLHDTTTGGPCGGVGKAHKKDSVVFVEYDTVSFSLQHDSIDINGYIKVYRRK